MDKHMKIFIGIGAVVLVVILLLYRRGSAATAPYQIPASSGTEGDTSLERLKLQAGTYGTLLQYQLETDRLAKESALQTAQLNTAKEVGLQSSADALAASRYQTDADVRLSLAGLTERLQELFTTNDLESRRLLAAEETNRLNNLQAIQLATVQANAQKSVANSQKNAAIFNGLFSVGKSIFDTVFGKNSNGSLTPTFPTVGFPTIGTGGKW